MVADTFEWDTTTPVTPLGQLPFFIEDLKQGGLFDGWWRIARCCSPARMRHANATYWAPCCYRCWPGHRRYAHVTALLYDAVNPPLLGMSKVVSEDALRRALAKIDETAGVKWLRAHSIIAYGPCSTIPGF